MESQTERRNPVVNDNEVRIGVTAKGNSDETEARRLAADLDRGDPRVDRVVSSPRYYATIWLTGSKVGFEAPEGYEIERVFITSTYHVALEIVKTDE
jgi:hypothetical protein